MIKMRKHDQVRTILLGLFCLILFGVENADAQQAPRNNDITGPTTDPIEARAVNTIFARWGIAADDRWNISGELCSGMASDNVTVLNPGINCDCSYNAGTVCHVVSMTVNPRSTVNPMTDYNTSSNVVGPLPDELWSLTYLTNLNLGHNLLTGPLSSSVGNLTRLQYLNLRTNALSGRLPSELGRLTDLTSLVIGTNNFNGTLPPELGNCTRLQQLWIDSTGISGPIPPTFARLRNMWLLHAPDVALSGRIPDFIGDWVQLTALRLEGNSLQGPIPSTFSNLTALIDLRISDLSNGNSSLSFLTNMKSLTTLVLRNNNISGSIPSNLNEYESLSLLDLSFNNFTGQIPNSLFNTSSLQYLFLGNNGLSGPLPQTKASSLQYIDLSYNQLSGSLPPWISERGLQHNLVANNFTLEASNISASLVGLNCLQRNFPCNRGNPLYSSFAVNCGGPQVPSFDGIIYQADNVMTGLAASYVAKDDKWAVSSGGIPLGVGYGDLLTNTTVLVKHAYITTLPNENPNLFQISRTSAGSLRYYGLGLENGGYNITLQFVENQIPKSNWESPGRCVFDIYIQGNLKWKDFDIRKEAGDSLIAVTRYFFAHVTDNHLEIHLFWAGKGTRGVPARGVYGPSIAAISVTPGDFVSTGGNNLTVGNNPPNGSSHKKNNTGMIAGSVVPIVMVGLLLIFGLYFWIRKRKLQKRYEDEELLGIEAKPYTFSYAELRTATDDFNDVNKLGEGGFGPVCKGKLDDGRIIAVKQLSVASRQGKSQFVTEIVTISAVQHRNLVKLYGCCIQGDKRLLVYEYLENKSLDQALFGKKKLSLDWSTRFGICLGVARGLAYLHEESRLRIVHRDVKAGNILLDSQFNPKISDFGLAKLYDDAKTHISTRVAGTIGYLAPEYAMRGRLTVKADVFSFGVVALEIVSGRANSDASLDEDRIYLLEWAWDCHENKRELDLVDTDLSEFDDEEVIRVIGVALLCTQTSPSSRPSMSRVVGMLCGDIEIPNVTSKPVYLTDWNFSDTSAFMVESEEHDSIAEISFYDNSTPLHLTIPNLSPVPAS